MPIELPDLPYDYSALEPHVSADTLEFHHGKHHRTYVKKTNKLIAGTALAEKTLEEIIRTVAGDPAKKEIFNNAAQAWNHAFYWKSMSPQGGGEPDGALAKRLGRDFGGYDGFRNAFEEAGEKQFGSGWVWLVDSGGRLEVRKTPNAKTPIVEDRTTPLLTMDVWEHAYYLDFKNERAKYVAAFLDNLVNWEFATANFGASSG